MTLHEFRELLVTYLTEPEYAEIERIAQDGLLVDLPDKGGHFSIKVARIEKPLTRPLET